MAARSNDSSRRPSERPARPPLRLVGRDEVIAASATRRASTGTRPRSNPPTSPARRDGMHLLILTVALNAFGLVMVLSASSVASLSTAGTPWSLFEKQVMWTVLGSIAAFVTARVDLARLRRLSVPLLAATTFLLLAVLAPGLGKTAGGSSRWIGAGPLRIQPSELSKLAFVIFVADLVARRASSRDEAREIVRPVAIVLAVMAILILKQPDMGTAIVLVCIGSSVLFAANIDRRLLATVIGGLFLAGSVLALAAPYRRARLLSFINPFAHASTTGYQVVQSLVALGSGHLTGTGIGGSVAKWDFLPNAWTDFIFAVIGNELGLVGSIAVLAAFVAFGCLGLRIAARAADRFSSLLAIGLTCWIVAQAFINIGGVVSVLPETGIPLPFLSSGGSSLVVGLSAVGLLVNIARAAPAEARSGQRAPTGARGSRVPRRAPMARPAAAGTR